MKTLPALAALVALSLSLSACATRYERRIGLVTDFDTGSPVSGAIVTQCALCGEPPNLISPCDQAKSTRKTKTDPFGQFKLPERKGLGGACVTNLRVEKKGYEPVEIRHGAEPTNLVMPDGRWGIALRAKAE